MAQKGEAVLSALVVGALRKPSVNHPQAEKKILPE
jgi:hypothetical protein